VFWFFAVESPSWLSVHGWIVEGLRGGAVFDLGDSGRLVFIQPFNRRGGALMAWESCSKVNNVVQAFRERVLKTSRSPHHFEKVNEPEHLKWPTGENACLYHIRKVGVMSSAAEPAFTSKLSGAVECLHRRSGQAYFGKV
jgi:hypothetical protein